MLATAAKLSRALAATFDVLLSELALEVQLEALLQVTQYPLPASAGAWAGGFWQIVSIKETNNFKGHGSSRWPFYFSFRVPCMLETSFCVTYVCALSKLHSPHGSASSDTLRSGLKECDRPLADSRSSDYRVPIGSALDPEIGGKRQICLFP